MTDDKYNITYGCGCIHEIEVEEMQHRPTGKQEQCNIHSKNEGE